MVLFLLNNKMTRYLATAYPIFLSLPRWQQLWILLLFGSFRSGLFKNGRRKIFWGLCVYASCRIDCNIFHIKSETPTFYYQYVHTQLTTDRFFWLFFSCMNMKCPECQCSPIDCRDFECSICTKDICCCFPRKESNRNLKDS